MLESLRISPSGLGYSRMAQKDMVIEGYQVPSGTTIFRLEGVAALDKTAYADPYEFKPERWIRGHPERAVIDRHTYLPFSHGPRSCPGQRFARLEMQMLILRLVQKYKIVYHGEPLDVSYLSVGKLITP